MAQYSRLGDLYNSQNLGSFEGYGVSNIFGNQFHGLGDFGGAAELLDEQIGQVQQDIQMSQAIGSGQGGACMQIPNGCSSSSPWAYTGFRGKTPLQVQQEGNQLLPQLISQRQQVGGGAAAAADSGTNAGEVLTGIAAILAPLAQAGIGIYGASQQAKLAKEQLKRGGGGGGGNDAALYAALAQRQQGGGSNSGIIIVVVLLVVGMMGMMMFMMNKKK